MVKMVNSSGGVLRAGRGSSNLFSDNDDVGVLATDGDGREGSPAEVRRTVGGRSCKWWLSRSAMVPPTSGFPAPGAHQGTTPGGTGTCEGPALRLPHPSRNRRCGLRRNDSPGYPTLFGTVALGSPLRTLGTVYRRVQQTVAVLLNHSRGGRPTTVRRTSRSLPPISEAPSGGSGASHRPGGSGRVYT